MNIANIRLFVGIGGFIVLVGLAGGYEKGQIDDIGLFRAMAVLAGVLTVTFWPSVHRGLSRTLNRLNRFMDEPVVSIPLSSEPRERMAQDSRKG